MDGEEIKTTAYLTPSGIEAVEAVVAEAKHRVRAAGLPVRPHATAKQVWLALGRLLAEDAALRDRLVDAITPEVAKR